MSSRNSAIIIGTAVGAVLGAAAAWAYTQTQEGKVPPGNTGNQQLQAGASDYVKIGVALFALLRQVTDLFKAP